MSPTEANRIQPARRTRRPGWRDPRLWLGLVLVAGCMLAGARLLQQADDSIGVWAVRSDLAVGDTVRAEDLIARQVRFVDADDAEAYLRTDEELPAELTLLRGVGAGELLPKAALGTLADTGLVQVPVALPATKVPPGLRAGSEVDVWASSTERPKARLVIQGAVVITATEQADEFGAGTDRQLVLGIPTEATSALAELIAAADSGTVTVVARG